MKTNDKVKENRLRRQCKKHGLTIRRSRKNESLDNFGQFMLIDLKTNAVINGSRFDMTLDDIEKYMKDL